MLRLLGNRYDELKEKLIAASKAMKVGYGLDESTEMGPLTSKAGKEKVEHFIEMGLQGRRKMVLDGRGIRVPGYEKGYFLAPTILEDVDSLHGSGKRRGLWSTGKSDPCQTILIR